MEDERPSTNGIRATIDRVLSLRELTRPDPNLQLWQYEPTDHDLSEIQSQLLKRDPLLSRFSREDAAGFTLLAAHRLCDRLSPGDWTWEPILTCLGWSDIQHSRLRELVEEGLLYWRRPLRRVSETREFLATLILEGGLPIHWFSEEGQAGFQQFFKRIAVYVGRTGCRAVVFANAHTHLLPKVARADQSTIDRLCDLIDQFVAIRSAVPENASDPIAYLDQAQPEWRARISLPKSGRKIVEKLLKATPPRLGMGKEATLTPILFDWHFDCAQNALYRRITVATEMRLETLVEVSGAPAISLPSTVYLSVQSASGRAIQIARLSRKPDGAFAASIDRPSVPVQGTENWQCVLSAAGREVARFIPPGAGAIPMGVPLVFEHDDSQDAQVAHLIALGSCNSSRKVVAVLVPTGTAPMVCESNRAATHIELIPSRSSSEHDYFTVSGNATFESIEGKFSIRTNAGENEPSSIVLSGLMFTQGICGPPPFKGAPSRIESFDGHQLQNIPREQLEWRPTREKGRWRRWAESKPIGDVCIRWQQAGGERARAYATVMPTDLEIVQAQGGPSSIGLISDDLCGIEFLEGRGCVNATMRGPGVYSVDVADCTSTPAVVGAMLTFRQDTSAVLTVPIPGAHARFVDLVGRPLPQAARVSLEELDTVKARCIGKAGLTLYANTSFGWHELSPPPSSQAVDWQEIALGSLAEEIRILFMGQNLDYALPICISTDGFPKPNAHHLCVSRYATDISPKSSADGVWLQRSGEPARAVAGVIGDDVEKIELFDLREPRLPPSRAQNAGGGRFFVSKSDFPQGPYLAVGFQHSLATTRPRFVEVGDLSSALTAPVEIGFLPLVRDRSLRRESWKNEAMLLAANPRHDTWPHADQLVRLTRSIPPQSFELLEAIAEDPEAACMAVVRARTTADQKCWLRALSSLGATPECLPIRDWIAAIARVNNHKDHLRDMYRYDSANKALADLAPTLFGVEGQVEGSAGVPRFLDVMRALAARLILKLKDETFSRQSSAMSQQRADVWNDCRVRHNDERWPQLRLRNGLSISPSISSPRLPAGGGFQECVFKAPEWALQISCNGTRPEHLEAGASSVIELLRRFDREWFEFAYAERLAKFICLNPELVEVDFDAQ